MICTLMNRTHEGRDGPVDEVIIFLTSGPLMRPTLRSEMLVNQHILRMRYTHNVEPIFQEVFVVSAYVEGDRESLRRINSSNQAAQSLVAENCIIMRPTTTYV